MPGIWWVQDKYLLNQEENISSMGFLMASQDLCSEVWQHPGYTEHLVSNCVPFLYSLLIFHLTRPDCPSSHETRRDSQNPLWPTEGSAMTVLLSSSSEAHLTPLGAGKPMPNLGFWNNSTVKRGHQKLGC